MASTPSRELSTAVLNDRAADRLRAGHPWIYDTDILGWEPAPPAEGTVAAVRSRRGPALGLADYSPHSKIRLRLLTPDPSASIDRAFLRARLAHALAYRAQIVAGSNAFRLVSAEADGLPGLIVDRYADAISFQTLTWAMAQRQAMVLELLDELVHPTTVVERNDVKVRALEGLDPTSGLRRGSSAVVEVSLNGIRFGVDLLAGQKTGGFLDQRENWAAAAARAAALGCRSALDVFTYQGGFALHLARAGLSVQAVDSSRPALEAAERNAALNRLPELDLVEANAFDLLRNYDQSRQQFDCIVLDPPAFAKSRANLKTAAAGYKEINLRALKLLRPGGLLVTCSCSHHLSEALLLEILQAAAADARRPLTLLERRGQALDHPTLLALPESAYLKCLLATVR